MTKEKQLTKEEVDLLFKGIRPEGMDYETFKKERNGLKNFIDTYIKEGQMVFRSKDLRVSPKGETYTKKKYGELHKSKNR